MPGSAILGHLVTPLRHGLVLAASLLLVVGTPAHAATTTWSGGTSTTFTTAGNWTGGAAPTSADIARFGQSPTRQPNLTGSATIGQLFFTGTTGTTITLSATAGALTLAGVSGVGITNTGSLTAFISAPLSISNTQTWSTGSTSAGLSISGTTLTLAANTLNVSTFTGSSVTISSVISGNAITKTGAGTLILSGANTYTGGTTLTLGTISANNNSALGTGTLTLAGGTLNSSSSNTITNATVVTATGANINNITVSGTLTQSGGNYTLGLDGATLSGSVNLSNNNTARTLSVTVGSGNTGTISGAIGNGGSGAGGLTKTGTGTLVLSGNSGFTGAATVSQGILTVAANNALGTNAAGTVVASGATLGIQGGINYSTAETVTISGTGAAGSSGAIDNVSGSNTFAGPILVATDSQIGATAGVLTLSGTLNLTAAAAADSILTFNTAAGSGINVTSSISDGLNTTKAISVTQVGNGTLTLSSGNNNYYGNTNVGVSGGTSTGTLALGANNAIPGVASTSSINVYTGTLSLGAFNTQASGNLTLGGGGSGSSANLTGTGTLTLAGNVTFDATNNPNGATIGSNLALSAGTHTFNIGNSSAATTDLTVSGVISGASDVVTSTGSGRMVFSGANTYTGSTTLNAGTLAVGSLANGGAASNLGASSSAASNLVLNNGTLEYTGAAVTSNRLFTVGLHGGTISNTGTGALSLTNTGAVGLSGAGARTLTLSGTNTGSNLLSASIGNNGGATSLVKTGTGTWVLNGSSTYTGSTTISAGTLNLQSGTALGTNTDSGAVFVASGAALELQGGITHSANSTLTLAGTGVAGGGALRNVSGANTWVGTSTNTASFIQLAGNTSIVNAATGTTSNQLTLGLAVPNIATNPDTYIGLNGNTLTFSGTNSNSYIVVNSQLGNVGGDAGSVVINGATVIMQGRQNTYTGTTSILDGKLLLDTYYYVPYKDHGLQGDVTVGDGVGSAHTAILQNTVTGGHTGNELIADTVNVTVNSDGYYDVNSQLETIHNLILNGGDVDTNLGHLYIGGTNVTYNANTASRASTISGNLDLNSSTTTFSVGHNSSLTTDLTISAFLFGNNLIKTGAGTMLISSDNVNGYYGTTTVSEGILAITHNNALGGNGGGVQSEGTVVNSGGTLQLQNNITVTLEGLWLNGNGAGGIGALNNLTGNNTWKGDVTLSSSSLVRSDQVGSTLTLTVGNVYGSAAAAGTQVLTVGGVGNTVIGGSIQNGANGGVLALTKQDTGTLTISGASSFTGTVSVNGGTLVAAANNTLGSQQNVVSLTTSSSAGNTGTISFVAGTNTIAGLIGGSSAAVSSTLAIASGATVILKNTTTDTFSGLISGLGTLELGSTNSSTVVLTNGSTTFGGTVLLDAGNKLQFVSTASGAFIQNLTLGNNTTLTLTGTTINIGTLHITGTTILDFGASTASILNATNVIIDVGATVTVNNWIHFTDYWFATNTFYQDNNGVHTVAVNDATGAIPENQITFNGFSNNATTWESYDVPTSAYPGGAFHQIRPVPEPSTYGAALLAASVALVLYRRRKQQRG